MTLLPLAEELNAQAAAAAGAAAARAEAEAERDAASSGLPPLAASYGVACADATAPSEPPAAPRDAARRALPPRPRAPWRASWPSRFLAAAAALLALALHEALGLRLLPRRGSAAFTALAAACVALPMAHALPTTSSRRRAALLHPPATQQHAFDDMAPASPPRAPRARAPAAAAARARAGDAWLRALADTAEADAAGAAAEQAGPPAAGADAAEVRRVLVARDHFSVLNVRRDADGAAARRAYRRAALLLHPDKCGAGLPGAPAAWQRVQAAGEALADDAARADYATALWRAESAAARPKKQPLQPARRRARRWAGLL